MWYFIPLATVLGTLRYYGIPSFMLKLNFINTTQHNIHHAE